MTEFDLSIFIFRRDLRIYDNTGFRAAHQRSKRVLACFIFDDRQGIDENEYFSAPAFQFMVESLEELSSQLQSNGSHLVICSGSPHQILNDLIASTGANAVFVNKDYTPFSRKRDKLLLDVCRDRRVEFVSHSDVLLTRPGEVLTKSGTPYTVFTPFLRSARSLHQVARPVPAPSLVPSPQVSIDRGVAYLKEVHPGLSHLCCCGGRSHALSILSKMEGFGNYNQSRNFPFNENSTTMLSPHHKFGTVSVRESYYAVVDALGYGSKLIDELYWRDFYSHVAYHFPHVFGEEFSAKYKGISWDGSEQHFTAWCAGNTGFPIVDAGMRQLNKTGWMHNRVRMIVASFLVKDLHVDWRKGEKYFAQKLVDYDPAVNNGSWQWAASTGTDAQPYFRIFNPWSQQKRFDPDAQYIKRYVLELVSLSPKQIHSLGSSSLEVAGYPRPIVDHAVERVKTLEQFKKYG